VQKLSHLGLCKDRAWQSLGFLGVGDPSGGIGDKVILFAEEAKEGFHGLEGVVLMGDGVGLAFSI